MSLKNSHFSITLPTKPYLHRFMLAKYGTPIVFSGDDLMGMVIFSCLEKNVMTERNQQFVVNACIKFEESMQLHLPIRWIVKEYYGTGVSLKHVIFINNFIESIFEKELYDYCYVATALGKQRKLAIEEFCRLHEIEIDEHCTYEGLKKMEYRYREKKMKKSPQNLSRQFTSGGVTPLKQAG